MLQYNIYFQVHLNKYYFYIFYVYVSCETSTRNTCSVNQCSKTLTTPLMSLHQQKNNILLDVLVSVGLLEIY